MQLILLERVRNLGDLGDEVNVKAGYGRNYLLPQGKAVRATAANREEFEGRRKELEQQSAEQLTRAQARAQDLEGASVTIAARAGEEGRLYGSVGPREVAEALTAANHEVNKADVRMPIGPIRVTGEYQVEIHLHSDVTCTVTVLVIAE